MAPRPSETDALIDQSPDAAGSSTDNRLTRRSVSRDVADFIRREIFNGGLKPDERLAQDELARRLGVSRVPVREALIALEGEGLVESAPYRGAFVVPLQPIDVEDHYTMYGMIHGHAAARAAGRATPEDIAQLRAIDADMRRKHDDPALRDLNWQFHTQINRIGGSRRLRGVLRQLAHNLPREVYDAPPVASERAHAQHARILEAIASGDGKLAAATCLEHMEDQGSFVIAMLDKAGVWTEPAA